MKRNKVPKDSVQATSFRLPATLSSALADTCHARRMTKQAAVVAALESWIADYAEPIARLEWALAAVNSELADEFRQYVTGAYDDPEYLRWFRVEINRALQHWIHTEYESCRDESVGRMDLTPDPDANFQDKIDAVLGSGDTAAINALVTTVDLIHQRLRPVQAAKTSNVA